MITRSPSFLRHAVGPALALAGTFVLAPVVPAQLEYCEDDGLIVFEVEDEAPAGNWVEETQFAGFAGSSYYRWNGGDQFNNPGLGVLTYQIYVTTPGDYQMRIHNHHNDPDSTMENDCWTRMDGSTWVKTYSGQNGWNWISRFEFSNGFKEPAHYDLTEGLHTFQISGRSQNFRIDRVHFFLSGNPLSTSIPASPLGRCDAPPAHPDNNPASITAVFADGTLGPLQTKSGTPVTLPNPGGQPGRHLALTGNERLVVPDVTYTDQELLLRVRRASLPLGGWIGLVMRAADEEVDFSAPGGTQCMVYLQRSAATGQVRVNVHDGTGTVLIGGWFTLAALDPDARNINMRVTTSGDTVQCRLNGMDALNGGYTGIQDPAGGGFTSLRANVSAGNPGTIGVDYLLVRNAGEIPDLYFDADGRMWMSAVEEDLIVLPTWQPGSFLFEHDAFMLGLPGFASIVFPFLDYQLNDNDHFVLGVVDSGLALPVGSSNVFEYKGQREGEFQP